MQEVVAALALSKMPSHIDSLMQQVQAAFPVRPRPPPRTWEAYGSRAVQVRSQTALAAKARLVQSRAQRKVKQKA